MLGVSDRWYAIGYCGNPLRIKARRFKWGDLVLMQALTLPAKGKKPGEELSVGTIFRRNRRMGIDTKGTSEWMRYKSLYEIWRAGQHIERRYHQDERVELEGFREKARAYVQYLIYVKNVQPEEKSAVIDAFVRAAESLTHKRAGRKVVAGARFMESLPEKRGEDFKDATGRRNPGAAAMIAGAGQGHLIERWEDAEAIVARTDLRTIEVFNAIQQHMLTYWNLWFAINPDVRTYRDPRMTQRLYLPETDGLNGPLRIHVKNASDTSLEDIRRQLVQYRDGIAAIVERPFSHNSAHTASDLNQACLRCEEGDVVTLALTLDKICNGIRWMFAQHVLQMSYITPLAFLIERLKRQERAKRGADDKTQPSITRAMATEEFAELEAAMEVFKTRVLKCDDQGLDRQLKEVALARTAFVQGLQDCDKWSEAKDAAIKLSLLF